MTDKEFNKVRRELQKCLDKWIPALGLDRMRSLRIQYEREDGPHDADVVGTCTPEWEYQHATIRFFCNRLMDADLDYFVRHELMHILVNQMATSGKTAKKNEEFVVTTLAVNFKRAWDAGFRAGRKSK